MTPIRSGSISGSRAARFSSSPRALTAFPESSPAARLFFGWRYDAFSRRGRLVFSFLAAAYFVIASSVLGFRKEQNRVEVWSNRLAMDRDIGLEIQLRGIEGAVASDPVIAAVSPLQNSNGLIQNRLAETYMARLAQNPKR